MDKTRCAFCGSDINGELPDGETEAGFAVKLNDVIHCAYCFKTKEPELWLRLGGENMLGRYVLCTE